jgi:murein L,D-transpeptidase YcbB/YkuD
LSLSVQDTPYEAEGLIREHALSGNRLISFGATAAIAVLTAGHALAAPQPYRPQPAPAAGQPYQPGATAAVAPPAPAPIPALRPDQIALLQRTLAEADSHGFRHNEFSAPGADALLQSQDPKQRQAGQGLLVDAALRYARAVHVGRLPTANFLNQWGMKPPAYDPRADFIAAVSQDRLGPWLDGLPPPYTGYQTLRGGLTVYRDIAAKGGWKPIPEGAELKLGVTDPRVLALRARLAAEDPEVADIAQGGPTFDQPLAQAVMRAQKRYGLEPTGAVGKSTLINLNAPVGQRILQIIANMERWRWLPPQLPADRIQVNIAAAVLSVFHQDSPTLSMRAVTGRPGDETPMLYSQISSIVLNPPWNVPSSIASKELWPKEKAHPGYLAANDFIVVPTGDGGNRIVQKAGPKAALGLIKFDFANPYGVYLHDTPSRSKFSSYSRLASHGCVRLQRPLVLAKAVMAGDPVWTPETIEETIASGKTVRAPLPQPIAVFLFYWTAYVAPDGQVNFRNDPYDWDRELMQRIDAASPAKA